MQYGPHPLRYQLAQTVAHSRVSDLETGIWVSFKPAGLCRHDRDELFRGGGEQAAPKAHF